MNEAKLTIGPVNPALKKKRRLARALGEVMANFLSGCNYDLIEIALIPVKHAAEPPESHPEWEACQRTPELQIADLKQVNAQLRDKLKRNGLWDDPE